MNKTRQVTIGKIGLLLGAALAGALMGCIGYDDAPRHGSMYTEPPPMYGATGVVVQPEYAYYPGYQVYYSSNTRQYVYREGRTWVSRPAPRGVSVQVLSGSPSVRMDFHDHPSVHHATVVRQYPKNWAPPGGSPHHEQGSDQGGRR